MNEYVEEAGEERESRDTRKVCVEEEGEERGGAANGKGMCSSSTKYRTRKV